LLLPDGKENRLATFVTAEPLDTQWFRTVGGYSNDSRAVFPSHQVEPNSSSAAKDDRFRPQHRAAITTSLDNSCIQPSALTIAGNIFRAKYTLHYFTVSI